MYRYALAVIDIAVINIKGYTHAVGAIGNNANEDINEANEIVNGFFIFTATAIITNEYIHIGQKSPIPALKKWMGTL